MKKIAKTMGKIVKWIMIAVVAVILLLLTVRAIGKAYYNRKPQGGINESMYVEINGTKQGCRHDRLCTPVTTYLSFFI